MLHEDGASRHMEEARFSAYEIRNAIGSLADGFPIEPPLRAAIHAALTGSCPTADRGPQSYVVALYAVNQHHVDTEELI